MSPIGKRILIIEDNVDVQELLKQILGRSGYTVEGCRGGGLAFEQILAFKPDLIISDMSLPEYNGIEITEILRRDKRFNAVPVIMLSAYSNSRFRKRATDAGVTCFISKPFDLSDLQKSIREILKSSLA